MTQPLLPTTMGSQTFRFDILDHKNHRQKNNVWAGRCNKATICRCKGHDQIDEMLWSNRNAPLAVCTCRYLPVHRAATALNIALSSLESAIKRILGRALPL